MMYENKLAVASYDSKLSEGKETKHGEMHCKNQDNQASNLKKSFQIQIGFNFPWWFPYVWLRSTLRETILLDLTARCKVESSQMS